MTIVLAQPTSMQMRNAKVAGTAKTTHDNEQEVRHA